MKTKFLKQSMSLLTAVLTLMSTVVVSASAEELLPEACGGAIYTSGDIDMSGCTFEDNSDKVTSYGGAIYASGDIDMSGCTFEDNSDKVTSYGGAIYASGDIDMSGCMFEDNTGAVPENFPAEGGAIDTSGVITVQESLTVNETSNAVTDKEGENAGGENAAEPVDSSGENLPADPVNDKADEEPEDGDQAVDATVPDTEDDAKSAEDAETVVTDNNEEDKISETAEDADASMPAEIPEDINEDTALTAAVAGMGLEAKVIPHPHQREPEEEALRGKNEQIRDTVAEVIIKIGESTIPFGHTIVNVIRSRSPQAKDMDNVETAIDLVADTASYAFPIAAPLVSVAKDIALKIRRLF